jgi:hypothetical protein
MRKTVDNNIKFLNFGFYLKRLSAFEIILVFLLLIFEFNIWYLKSNTIGKDFLMNLDSITFVSLWGIPLFFSLSNNFRNIIFSLLWFLMCLIWLILKEDFITSILPLTIFVYLNLARFIFKAIFKYEPIFMIPSKFGPYYGYNKIEKRESNRVDFIFSMLAFTFGAILSILIPNLKSFS